MMLARSTKEGTNIMNHNLDDSILSYFLYHTK